MSQSPAKFQAYYAKFKAAVKKGDKNAVASMTAFPFQHDYGQDGETYAKTQFLARFNNVFGKATVFSKADPVIFEFKSGYISLFEPNEEVPGFMFKLSAGSYSFYKTAPIVWIKIESTEPEFQSFYTKMRNAVISGNKNAIADLTRFPFEVSKSYDQAEKETVKYSRAEFLKQMKFDAENFEKDLELVVNDDGTYSTYGEYTECSCDYVFKKIGGVYKLVQVYEF